MAQRTGNGNVPPAEEKPTEAAFRALVRTYGLLGRAMQPFFTRFGITASQFAVLRILHRTETDCPAAGPTGGAGAKGRPDRGLRQTELGDRLLVRPPSVTGVIDRLQRQGLVARDPSPHDLRAKYVYLTPAGRRLVERILVEHAQRVGTVLGALDVSEQKELNRLLGLLGSHLQALCDGEDKGARDVHDVHDVEHGEESCEKD